LKKNVLKIKNHSLVWQVGRWTESEYFGPWIGCTGNVWAINGRFW